MTRMLFHNNHLLWLTVVTLLIVGLMALNNLPRIEDPRFTTRNATIITHLPGAPAERVEALVTQTIERGLRELDEISEIKSTSRANISLISIELDDTMSVDGNEDAMARVRARLNDLAAKLPAQAGEPVFDDQRSAVAFAMVVALRWSAGDGAPRSLGRFAKALADDLRNLAGTEEVRLFGLPEEEIVVEVDAGELAAVVAVTLRESRHVVATAATTVGGFLPLLLASKGEFWPPLATVLAGGVAFSLVLSLVFTPAAYRLQKDAFGIK